MASGACLIWMINPTEDARRLQENYAGTSRSRSQMARGYIAATPDALTTPVNHPGRTAPSLLPPEESLPRPSLARGGGGGGGGRHPRPPGPVWSCQNCLWLQRDDVAGSLLRSMPEIGERVWMKRPDGAEGEVEAYIVREASPSWFWASPPAGKSLLCRSMPADGTRVRVAPSNRRTCR
jgi:hypothetical protein